MKVIEQKIKNNHNHLNYRCYFIVQLVKIGYISCCKNVVKIYNLHGWVIYKLIVGESELLMGV